MSTIIGATQIPAISNLAGNSSILALATLSLSSNKYILGLMILLINLGAKNISSELNEVSHKILSHKYSRRFLIFLLIWMGTRDLLTAFVITTGFILLSNTLLNAESSLCILPIENENESSVSKEEYQFAKNMVFKYEQTHQTVVGNLSPIPGGSKTHLAPV